MLGMEHRDALQTPPGGAPQMLHDVSFHDFFAAVVVVH